MHPTTLVPQTTPVLDGLYAESMNYFLQKGSRFVRIVFSWNEERLCPWFIGMRIIL